MGRVYNKKTKKRRISVVLTTEGSAAREEGERRSYGRSPRRKAHVSGRHRALSFIPWAGRGPCVARWSSWGVATGCRPLDGELSRAHAVGSLTWRGNRWAHWPRGQGRVGPALTAPWRPCSFVCLSALPRLPKLSAPESSVLTGRRRVHSGTEVFRQTVAGPLRLRRRCPENRGAPCIKRCAQS